MCRNVENFKNIFSKRKINCDGKIKNQFEIIFTNILLFNMGSSKLIILFDKNVLKLPPVLWCIGKQQISSISSKLFLTGVSHPVLEIQTNWKKNWVQKGKSVEPSMCSHLGQWHRLLLSFIKSKHCQN
jgi:hypothetical protein